MIIPTRLRALVVDDNSYARAIAMMSLKKLGVGEVVEVSSGAEAVLSLMTETFSLMVTDWFMPDINGAGLMQILRDPRFGHASGLPVILMTAYMSRDTIARARSVGIDEILPKPFTTEQLGLAMGRVLKSQGSADEASVFL